VSGEAAALRRQTAEESTNMEEREKPVVLVVEDQFINRKILNNILAQEYEVAEAENGADALEVLQRRPEITAILLDIIMPVMDGYTFMEHLHATPFSALPVIAITGEKDENAEQKALDLGAWDFVSKPYRPATLLTRLKNVIVRSQYYLVNQMKYVYEHDPVTDLYNRTAFFSYTRRLLDRETGTQFALVRFDIDHFQTYNSFWGEEEGDRLLNFVGQRLRQVGARCEPCVYGRINADAFCICMPYQAQAIADYVEKAAAELGNYNREYRLVPSFGVYVILDPQEKIQKMYELATIAAQECKGSILKYLSYYRPEMSERLLRNQWIVNEMQTALEEEQFEVYLQPKYNLATEQPYGAEALIRWNHPERGMLSPGLFIPIFEQNGFIGRVDAYMWEQVCLLLRRWIDEGRSPAPVSVNVSRVNLYNPNLVSSLCQLVKKYRIPAGLLQLELTESAYMENPAVMEQTVQGLQKAGFTILMDDFGSGYSSLNTLKDIRVNVLKIDMKFLSGESDAARSHCILASVIRMAGWLDMPVITEGVETAQQADFLKSVGCSYAQGYYYARPMPVAQYEKLIDGVRQQPTDVRTENLGVIADTLWSDQADSALLFRDMDTPAVLCEYENGQIHALRANLAFTKRCSLHFGNGAAENGLCGKLSLAAPDAAAVQAAFTRAVETRQPASCEFSAPAQADVPGRVRMKLKYWGLNETAHILFAQFFLIPREGERTGE
jgi:diguanylate cyclase (GGDEF)-like protein